MVALLAGVAGTLSLTSAKSGALVGVAISVTTVPAGANAAVALSYGDLSQTWGSIEQLGLQPLPHHAGRDAHAVRAEAAVAHPARTVAPRTPLRGTRMRAPAEPAGALALA
ncbi:hypothetical protein STANM309S_01135 [Streptomyces tanashiensis]